jgi:hypothetical protein
MAAGLVTWSDYLDSLKPAERVLDMALHPEGDQTRLELYKAFMTYLAVGYMKFFASDADHPDWYPSNNSIFTLQPNPDDAYMHCPIRGDRAYRIVGERGGVHILTFGVGGAGMGAMSGYYDVDADLEIPPDADGRYEVVLSAERPPGHTGNWWKIGKDDTYVIMRQRSLNWGEDKDPRTAIEPLDWLPLKPRLSKEQIAANLAGMRRDMEALSELWMIYHHEIRDNGAINRFEWSRFGDTAGLGTGVQHYWQCIYDFEPGEALIVETPIPDPCRYWNVQVNDLLFNCVEFVQRQSSLNMNQARLDSDGWFRFVVALEDPGVPNWIDPAGFSKGVLLGRWYQTTTQPMPTLKKVRLADIRAHLPADTPVVVAAEREAVLRKRRLGGQLRRRW